MITLCSKCEAEIDIDEDEILCAKCEGPCPSCVALHAENERLRKVVKAGKECSKQYFFDLNYDSAEFYVAMERLYAALKKLEEG